MSAFATPAEPGQPLRERERRVIRQGRTMLLGHEEIHRVDQVDPHTYTVLVQGPAARGFSTCYDLVSGTSRQVYDLRSRLPGTLAHLSMSRLQPVRSSSRVSP
ncbi:hypothetical protein GCM10009555_082520 [Acrocarpospora macrocephala]|uniref:Uncharacterized protein n=1 Tax=Acrocarpospora macrocephala TaxID=150177 RepID=A0A5M3WQK5_9ACTN|nr:hypothetical protein [Acrocarpospora macrocephala]GES10860.1 hypothetical protein Amac_044570 [Acrocarpospora macrocephala]